MAKIDNKLKEVMDVFYDIDSDEELNKCIRVKK